MEGEYGGLLIRRRGPAMLGWLILVAASGICVSGPMPTGRIVGAVQFDTVLEFNAPRVQTHVLLFARYWVAPDHYTISVVWAEPHIRDLNFAMYPPTLVISSDSEQFEISSQTDTWINATYPKPVGQRGVFRYMFNDYPVHNIRFAEEEARAARLYTPDFGGLKTTDMAGERVVTLSSAGDPCQPTRFVTKLRVRAQEGRAQSLELFDRQERLVKRVDYEYLNDSNDSALRQQRAFLPQAPITVGFQNGGIQFSMGGDTQTYTELWSTHHRGSRQCVVEYRPTQIGGQAITLPVAVAVQDAATKTQLRCVRLSNFKPTTSSREEIRQRAEHFSHFDSQALACRKMAAKYWLKDPETVAPEDKQLLSQLQTHFEDDCPASATIGEQLRRVNMLLQLDWLLADTNKLRRHYDEYLRMLESHDMDQMALVGGQRIVETTALWGYLSTADVLLSRWADRAVAVRDDASLQQFTVRELGRGSLWTTVNLMKKLIERRQSDPSVRFQTHALYYMAFSQLCEHRQQAERFKRDFDVTQIGWASTSMSREGFLASLRDSLIGARQAFGAISKPTASEKALMAELHKLARVGETNDPNKAGNDD